MKSKIILTILAVAMFFMGRRKADPKIDVPKNGETIISNPKCKQKKVGEMANEYLILKAINNNQLQIKHYGGVFNCMPIEIVIKYAIDNGIIMVDEDEKEHTANCICPYDLEYNIEPLLQKSYKIIIRKGGIETINFTINFTSNFSETINLNQ